ncbi:MAG: ParB N-terminal domain-containing protein [Elusimicrobiota bacterium]
MARKIKSKVKIDEIYFDEELYPRSAYNWQTGYIYSQSMKAGAKFPPITIALYKGTKYLVDGKHRLEAYKINKKKEIEAVIYTGWNRKKIFLEAVKANIAHGRNLSPYERRRIGLKLKEMNLSKKDISKLIQVPQDKLQNFIGERLINSVTGKEQSIEETERNSKEIGQAILKSGVKHYAGTTVDYPEYQKIQESQKDFHSNSQEYLIKELISLIEEGLLDLENQRIVELITKLKSLLEGF